MPVDPLVPSKIREPVNGRRSPSRSAFSITYEDCQRLMRYSQHHVGHTRKRDAVLYASPWVEVLRVDLGSETMTADGYSIAAQAYLSFSKNLDSQCIAERVDPDQRCISLGANRPVSLGRVDRVLCWTRTNQPRHSIQYLVTP